MSVTLTGNYLRKNNEITINSPLGSSIFAKAKGEGFKFKVGKQESKGIINEIIKSEEKNKQEERSL